ncbi:MAG: ATP synthase F1 subunit delta [Acidobacteria bacterium]|nr:ATP synthase F1 subunit delta [Acidobacteriota bacterium]
MLDTIIATRYAKALYQAAPEEKEFVKIRDSFDYFIKLFGDNKELNAVLLSPAISPLKKKKIITDLSEKAGFHPVFIRLLLLITDKGRLNIVETIYNEFLAFIDKEAGIERAKLFYSDELSPTEQKDIQAELSRITGKDIKMELHQDPALIGGVKIQIGGVIYDGSIRNRLEMMRKQLTGD